MRPSIAPGAFADALRNPESPQWKEAYDLLVVMLRRHLRGGRRWPRAKEVGGRPDRDLAFELADEFWLMLKDNPRMLNAAAVRGYGAIDTQIIRLLRRPRSVILELAEPRLKEHFATKLREVLHNGSYLELRRNLWGTIGLPERSADADALERVRLRQPLLPADWEPQRSLQDPPIVRLDALADHLNSVFRLANSYCSLGDLHELCWKALRPALSAVLPHVRVPEGQSGDEKTVSDDFRDFELPALLQGYFDSLSPETQAFVKLAYGEEGASLRQIEAATGARRTTVARRLDEAQTGLGAYLRSKGYTAADGDALILIWRAIFES